MSRRQTQLSFTALKLLSDLILIPFVIILAYSLKFKVGWVAQNIFDLDFGRIYHHAQVEPYLNVLGVIVVTWILAFYLIGLYRPTSGIMPEIDESYKIVKGVSLASVQVIFLSYFFDVFPASRYVIAYSWACGILVLGLSRVLLTKAEKRMLRKGVGANRALILGAGAMGQDIAEKMILFPMLRLHYVGTCDENEPQERHYHLRERFQLLGGLEDYSALSKQHEIQTIFLSRRDVPKPFIEQLIQFCEAEDIELKIVSEMLSEHPLHITETMDGIPVLSSMSEPNFRQRAIKRGFDIVFSGAMLLLLSPVLLLLAMAIKGFGGRGSILYRQKRVGRNGVSFDMLKFRSMVEDAEAGSGPVMVDESGDTRYTTLGKWLRTWSLDELPQLWNVLVGEMSIVGPRPERPFFVDKFKSENPSYDLRHRVRGGITGWAQVNGRSVLTRRPEHKVRYDLYYLKNQSFILDVKIIAKTLFVVLNKEEAY